MKTILATTLALATLAAGSAAHAANCGTQANLKVVGKSKNGNPVVFRMDEPQYKVRGGTWRKRSHPAQGRTFGPGTHAINGNVNFAQKCNKRRAMKVRGQCIVTSDGQDYRQTYHKETSVRSKKGDHNFGTITVCENIAPEGDTKYRARVKFCGFVGPASNFERLSFLDGNPTIQEVFKEKKIKLKLKSFNGNDKVRATARQKKDIKVGETKNFKCNKNKGGCRFRVILKDDAEFSRGRIDLGDIRFEADNTLSGASKATNLVLKVTKAKASVKPKRYRDDGSNHWTGAKYFFNPWDVTLTEGTSCN